MSLTHSLTYSITSITKKIHLQYKWIFEDWDPIDSMLCRSIRAWTQVILQMKTNLKDMIKPNEFIYTQIYRIDLVVFRFVHFDLECSMFLAGKQSWIQFIKEVTIKTYVRGGIPNWGSDLTRSVKRNIRGEFPPEDRI